MWVATPRCMPSESRCYTVRPTAAPREGLTLLVIDSTVSEAEKMCAGLREDGHVAQACDYDDEDLLNVIAASSPQVIAIRMRVGGGARGTRSRVRRAFPHIHLVSLSSSKVDDVREQLPRCWTDVYELAPGRMPRASGFPRAMREVIEDLLSA